MVLPTMVQFQAGAAGPWRIERLETVLGEGLEPATHLSVHDGRERVADVGAVWSLRGCTSNERYVERSERSSLVARQPPLGREEAVCAALIPIRKTATWWDMTQDERRDVLEARSRHIETGLRYLPAVARRLHHSRDLGEPFDFLTWFEYAHGDAAAFEELVARLRETDEWSYVEREVDIRLVRAR